MSSQGHRRLSNDADVELPNLDGSSNLLDNGDADSSTGGELSGIYFGILNIYTTIPQFIGCLIAAVVFAVLEPGKSSELAGEQGLPKTEGPNAIAVCLFIGALCAVVASFATRKLKDS